MTRVRSGRVGFALSARALSKEMLRHTRVDSVSPMASGMEIRTRFPSEATRALQALGCSVTLCRPTAKLVEIRLSGIPLSVHPDEVLKDLQTTRARVTSVRLTHFVTDGAVDKDRPIPGMFATLEEPSAPRLMGWRLFGILPVWVGRPRPRERIPVKYCGRC